MPRMRACNSLQYSRLENAGAGVWQATVHRVAKSRTGLKRLSMNAHTQFRERKAHPKTVKPTEAILASL